MFKKMNNYFEIESLKKHGFYGVYTKKNAGNMSFYNLGGKKEAIENRKKVLEELKINNKELFFAKQSHSNNIHIIKQNENGNEIENCDGFVSNRDDIVMLTQFADCLPIYMIDKKTGYFALLHSGWKGSFNKIVINCINILKNNFNSKLSDIYIVLGIGIKACCYEVGDEFYNDFSDKYSIELLDKSFLRLGDRYYFDNEIFNYNILLEYGIDKNNIKISNICNKCSNQFFSFRKEKELSGRNAAMFWKV